VDRRRAAGRPAGREFGAGGICLRGLGFEFIRGSAHQQRMRLMVCASLIRFAFLPSFLPLSQPVCQTASIGGLFLGERATACVGGGAHAAIFPAAGTLVGCLVLVGLGLPVWSLGGWLAPRGRMRMPDLFMCGVAVHEMY